MEETLMQRFTAADMAMAQANREMARFQSMLGGMSNNSNNVMSMFGMPS
jgi:hypothetical protein